MNLIFIITYSFWFLSEILINRFLLSKKADKQNADKGSLRLIWILIFASISLAVYVSGKYAFPLLNNGMIEYLGLLLIGMGVVLRLAVIKALGRFFTADVTIRQDHRLKKDGFYKYLRHPSYSASLLSFIGFGVSLNNLVSLLIVFILILTAFSFRIKIEEKTLTEHFGTEYEDYKKSTKRFIPFIY